MKMISGIRCQMEVACISSRLQGSSPSEATSTLTAASVIESFSRQGCCSGFWSCVAFPFKKMGEAFVAFVKFLILLDTPSSEDTSIAEDKLRCFLHAYLQKAPISLVPVHLEGAVSAINAIPKSSRLEMARCYKKACIYNGAISFNAAHYQRIVKGQIAIDDSSKQEVAETWGGYLDFLIKNIGPERAEAIFQEEVCK